MELRYCERCGDIIQLEGKTDPAHPTEHFVCPRCQGVAGGAKAPAGTGKASAPVSLEKVLDSTSMNLFSSNTILIKRQEQKDKEDAVRQSRLKLADEVVAGGGELSALGEGEDDSGDPAGSAIPSRNARKLQFRCLHCRAVLMVRPVEKASRIICPKCQESLYIDQTGIVSRRPSGAKAAPPAGTAVVKPGSARMAVQDDSSLLDPATAAAAAAPSIEHDPLRQGKSFRAQATTAPAAPSRSFRTELPRVPAAPAKSFRAQTQAAAPNPASARLSASPQPSKSFRRAPPSPPPTPARQPSSAVRKSSAVKGASPAPRKQASPSAPQHGSSPAGGFEWDDAEPASSLASQDPLGNSDLGVFPSPVKGPEPFSCEEPASPPAVDPSEGPSLLADSPSPQRREAPSAGLVGDLTAEEDFTAKLEEKEKGVGLRTAPGTLKAMDWATSSAILVRAAVFAILLAAPFLAAGFIVTPKVSDADAALHDASPLAVFERLGKVVQQGVGKLSRHLENWSGVEK